MAWQRRIPFGYQMTGGEIQCCPTESEAVKTIFSLYSGGDAYSKIAERMMQEGIPYHKHTTDWNKHMVKRILENECYLGEKGYPAIIEPEEFLQVQLVRSDKTTFAPAPAYIHPIRDKAICGVCGGRMLRDTRAAGKVRWYCENESCGNRHYIADSNMREALTERLITLAENPQLLDWPMPRHMHELTLEQARIQNEVTRELNKSAPGTEYTKMLIFASAAERYSGLPDDTDHRKLQRMQSRIASQPIDDTICEELLQTAVAQICITADGKLALRLINQNIVEQKEDTPCPQPQIEK